MTSNNFENIQVGTGEDLITLTRWVIAQQQVGILHNHNDRLVFILLLLQDVPEATGDLTLLLTAIQFGCKFVASKVKQAGLINLLGLTGAANVQGEDVKKLDILANDIFRNALIGSGKACLLVSEEDENAMIIENKDQRGKYVVTFDPLDGSSNIDCGVSIGTIFGIFKVVSLIKKKNSALKKRSNTFCRKMKVILISVIVSEVVESQLPLVTVCTDPTVK